MASHRATIIHARDLKLQTALPESWYKAAGILARRKKQVAQELKQIKGEWRKWSRRLSDDARLRKDCNELSISQRSKLLEVL